MTGAWYEVPAWVREFMDATDGTRYVEHVFIGVDTDTGWLLLKGQVRVAWGTDMGGTRTVLFHGSNGLPLKYWLPLDLPPPKVDWVGVMLNRWEDL